MAISSLIKRHVALPAEHGAWVFLGTPLVIGLFAGGSAAAVDSAVLVVACLAGFLIRQPITLVVKTLAGRRSRDTLPAAAFWIVVYGSICLVAGGFLVARGHGYILLLGIPAAAVLGWHLVLVSRRAERRQWLVELVGAGVLALAAPAALWVGVGAADPVGWWLWGASWAQSAASILHAYVRLGQRKPARQAGPGPGVSFAVSLGNLLAAGALSWGGFVPRWVFVAYVPQWIEAVEAIRRPATGVRPATIGYRQLAVSLVFTVVLVLAWR